MKPHRDTLTRRDLLLRGGTAAAGMAALRTAAPAAGAVRRDSGFTGTLRVLGIGASEFDQIKRMAEKDLGFKIAFAVTGNDALAHRAATEPASFDVLADFYFVYDLVWIARGMQPIDTRRITRWPEVNTLFKYGKAHRGDDRCTYGQGDAPFRMMYIDESGHYRRSPNVLPEAKEIVQWVDERTGEPFQGLAEPRYVNAVPGYFGMDSIGYNSRVISRPPERVSWAELVNRRWKGRVALFGGSQIGFLDAGCAAEAAGLMRFGNKGDMSRSEIDRLTKILVRLKRQRHFYGFWDESNAKQSAKFMHSGEVVVESMWPAQVTELRAKRFPVRYAAPPEGYRGWANGFAISSAITDPARLQAAYDYINWWHSGGPGALTMRIGYYNAVQSTTRRLVEPAEWDYWIEGKPAAKNLRDPFGNLAILKGQVREGGSFARRVCRYAVWNSVFREHAYQERRWHDFRQA